MNKGEYFKIETVEELKQAYEIFKDEWWKSFTLEEEIKDFKEINARHIVKDGDGEVHLSLKEWIVDCEEIPSPLKKQEGKSNLQKTLEIGNLNMRILKYLTASGIVDEKLTGAKAQEIVGKIEELSKIILK